VLVIACSDSRVDPAQIFDVDPGEIFVVRNVAAMVPPYETSPGHHGVSAALEFAVQVLKVKEVVVMGHGMCGGCKAALTQSLHGAEHGAAACGGLDRPWTSARAGRGGTWHRGPHRRTRHGTGRRAGQPGQSAQLSMGGTEGRAAN
jgi:carbonic anhydrase